MLRPYIFVKKFSFIMLYFSLFSLVLTGGLYFLHQSKSSADTTNILPNLRVIVAPSVNDAAADSHTSIEVGMALSSEIYQGNLGDYADHISLFATKEGVTFNPNNDTAGRTSICTAAAKSNEPLNYIGKSTCDSSGVCSPVSWVAPSNSGAHQLFAVAMLSDAACTAENIVGWSVLEDSHMVNIYKGKVEASGIMTVSYPDQATLNKPFKIRVQVANNNPSNDIDKAKIDHVSLLVSSNDSVDTAITNNYICEQANKTDNVGRTLFSHAQFDLWDPDGTIKNNDDHQVDITLSSTGSHRIVVVGGYYKDESCNPAALPEGNVVEVNSAGIVKVISASDPGGTGPGTGGGGGSGGGSGGIPIGAKLTNPTKIETFADALNKYSWLVATFIGILAFSGLVYAGFGYMTAGGNDKMVDRSKKAIIYAVTSIFIVFLSYAIVRAAVDILNSETLF